LILAHPAYSKFSEVPLHIAEFKNRALPSFRSDEGDDGESSRHQVFLNAWMIAGVASGCPTKV
jgi:hypothetical protein